MKTIITIILIVIFLVIGAQLYRLYVQNSNLEGELSEIDQELENISKENVILGADLEYFANPDNLAKELKGRLNYKSPGEKLIIIVPSNTD